MGKLTHKKRGANPRPLERRDIMKVKLIVELSKQAQKEAVVAGLSATKRQELEVDVDPKWVDSAQINPDGCVVIDTVGYYEATAWPSAPEDILEQWHEARENYRVAKAAKDVEYERHNIKVFPLRYQPSEVPEDLREFVIQAHEAEAERKRRQVAEDVARIERHRDLEEAEKEVEAQKIKYLVTFIRECGTPSQKERQAEGLLSRKEALDTLKDHMFEGYEEFPRYERMSGHEEYSSDEAGSATENQWQQLKELRSVDEANYVVLREHRGYDGDEVVEVRYGALVTCQAGPWTLTREFAID
jgi:hypothetical protein